jgi:TetR/AcrR family transcriptional regulator, regulator of autoinduction and epiphytic fitness
MDIATTATRKRGRPQRDSQPILDAAVTVFAREGYSAATIDMISAAASVSTATLYKKFENKQSLFVAVLAQMTKAYWNGQGEKRATQDHPFDALLNSLTNHAIVSCQPAVRGMMRAWLSEVGHNQDLSAQFARTSGTKLLEELRQQLDGLERSGYIDFSADEGVASEIAAQLMLGIVERFTLMRGLVWGDNASPLMAPDQIALKALQAMVAIYGTPEGKARLPLPCANDNETRIHQDAEPMFT